MYLSSLFLSKLDETVSQDSVNHALCHVEKYIASYPPNHFDFEEVRALWDVCKEFDEISNYPHLHSLLSKCEFQKNDLIR